MKIKDRLTLIVLKKAILNRNLKKIAKIIEKNDFNENILDNEIITSILKLGYVPNKQTPFTIRSNSKYLELIISRSIYNWSALDFFTEEALTPEVINKAIEGGYQLSEKTKPSISGNKEYVAAIINKLIEEYYHVGAETTSNLIATNLRYCDNNFIPEIISNILTKRIYITPTSLALLINQTKPPFEIVKEIMSSLHEYGIQIFIENLDEQVLNEEIMIHAIEHELKFETTTPKQILQNPKCIKSYIQKTQTNCDEVIKLCDITSLTEEDFDILFIKSIISNERNANEFFPFGPIKNCSDTNFDKVNWSKYITWINLSELNYYTKSILGYSDMESYFSSKGIHLERNIEEEKKFVLKLIESTDDIDALSRIMALSKKEIIDDIVKNHFDILKNKNFRVFSELPEVLLQSEEYLKLLINNNDDIDIITSAINNFHPSILKDEIIRTAINKGYYITSSSPDIIKQNTKIAWNIINKNDDIEAIHSTINRLNENSLTEALIMAAINKGYFITSKSPLSIKNNIDYIKKIISSTNNVYNINQTMNNCEYSLIDKELVEYAIEYGFICELPRMQETLEGPARFGFIITDDGLQVDTSYHDQTKQRFTKYISLLESYPELINKIIKVQLQHQNKRCNNLIEIIMCIKHNIKNFGILNHIKVLKENNFAITANNFEQIIELTTNAEEEIKQKLTDIEPEHRELIEYFVKNFGNNFAVYYEIDNLFSKEMFKNYTKNEIFKIYKYLFLADKRINFNSIINAGELNKFKKLYEILYGNFEVETLYNYYQKYLNHHQIIQKIDITNPPKKIIEQIKTVFLLNYSDVELKGDELDNYIEKIYQRNQKHMNTIEELKNTISLLLFNHEFKEVKNFYDFDLSYEKAINLAQSIKDEDIKYILKKYAIIQKFFKDNILDNQDFESLLTIANSLNNQLINNNQTLRDIHNLFSKMKDKILMIYGIELNEQLGKLQNEPNCKSIIHIEGKYTSKNTEYGIQGKKVDYIEYNDEVYFLQHKMNAYGHGAKITDWKNPRLIGKTYICLSLVSNNTEGVSRRNSDEIDNVTVLFKTFSPQNLKTFGASDLYTEAENNSTIIRQRRKCQLDTIKNIVKNTQINFHNEYTILRENEDGSLMYPCGVKVTGDTPTKSEIDAAAYLGVPLIKLNRIDTKKQIITTEEKEPEIIPSISQIEELEEQLVSLTTSPTHKR